MGFSVDGMVGALVTFGAAVVGFSVDGIEGALVAFGEAVVGFSVDGKVGVLVSPLFSSHHGNAAYSFLFAMRSFSSSCHSAWCASHPSKHVSIDHDRAPAPIREL